MYLNDRQRLYLLAGLASLALSLWAFHDKPLFNPDGVYYLQAAQGDQDSIRIIGHWLLYPYLIEVFHRITLLSHEHSAYLVNALLDVLVVLSFLRLVELLGGQTRTLLWAALVILSLPYFNDNRAEIIRDHGYWAFGLIALIALFKIHQRPEWKWIGLWNGSMLLATLFRIEGTVFLLLLPLALLLNPQQSFKQRTQAVAKTWLPLLALALLTMPWWWSAATLEGSRIGQLLHHSNEVFNLFSQQIPQKAQRLHHWLLPEFSADVPLAMLYFGIAYSILSDVWESLSWLYALLLLAIFKLPPKGLNPVAYRLIFAYVALNLAILIVHCAMHWVMVARYTLPLSLSLLLFVPFQLQYLQTLAQRDTHAKKALLAVALGITFLFADSVINTHWPKVYITDAAQWSRTHLQHGETVVVDYRWQRLAYLTNQNNPHPVRFVRYQAGMSLENFDYAFVRTVERHSDSPLHRAVKRARGQKRLELHPEKGKGLIIYKLHTSP